jgi:predicted AAA+ superfamily ATPase
VSFELPWPWAGERFELRDIRPLNYIVGPLGSGKTRFVQRLAESLPGASFLGLERLEGTDPLTALLRGLQAAGPIIVDMVEQGHRILARGVTNQFRRVWLRPRCAPG